MRLDRIALALTFLFLHPAVSLFAARPLDFSDLMAARRISSPVVSPDGRWVAYVETTHDPETLSSDTQIFILSILGGEPRRLTADPAGSRNPMFTPDGRELLFVSSRGGTNQVYSLPLDTGGEALRLTDQPGGVSEVTLSPDGKWLLYTARVLVDSQSVVGMEDGRAPEARIIDNLLFRHWDHWRDGRYSHLFIAPAVPGGEARDLTPGKVDCPPISLGSPRDFAVSPDGKHVYYVANRDGVVATSTNNDIWRVDVDGSNLTKITVNPANDNLIALSPNGRFLAWREMARAGFESDKQDIRLLDLSSGKSANLTAGLDRSANELVWDPAGRFIYFTAEDEGRVSIYRVNAVLDGKPVITRLADGHTWSSISVTPDGKNIVALRQSFTEPQEIFLLSVDGRTVRALTARNREVLADVDMNPGEGFRFEAEDGVMVHGWLIRPPGFDPSRKYPLLYLIHGGPQSAWTDQFHYRWNAQMFAAWGYVAVLVNPRGSTGYGQLFTDQITGDWGGRVYRDLMRGLDHVIANYSFVDSTRMGAAGASYGGYMVNWIQGHSRRFRCLVNHNGVFNLESMYASTEELWFPEWEFGGTPWENPTLYRMWSPHRFAADFATPMLVIHSDRDYRVPPEQGLMAFTTLRRMGIDSRLLFFPDEGHWVLDPKNSRLWYATIRDWLDKYLK